MAAEIEYEKGEKKEHLPGDKFFKKIHPWEYQPEIETAKNYIFFQIYKDLGVERSLRKVVKKSKLLTKVEPYSLNSLKQLRSRCNWRERAQAWDLHLLQEWSKNREERVHQMCTGHIKDAQTFHKKIMFEMDRHSDEVPNEKRAYYYDAMTRSYERMARLERISNGEVVEFDGLRLDTDYTAKDLDKLLKDPELTGDLTTLLDRVDQKIGKKIEEEVEEDRPKKEEFENLYDKEEIVKKENKNKEWWE